MSIASIFPCASLNQLVYFLYIDDAHHRILIIYKSASATGNMSSCYENRFIYLISRLNTI